MTLSPLGQRLERVARSPELKWRVLVENVPVWPSAPLRRLIPPCDSEERYAPSQGLDILLGALRDRGRQQGIEVGTESILVTNGAFDALSLVIRHARSRGASRAICAGPVVRNAADMFRAAGLHLVVEDWATLLTEQAWRSMDLGPHHLLYVNTPHNPTGACLDELLARDLVNEQRRRQFTLVFDLVYDAFVHGPVSPSPLSFVEDWHGVYGLNSFSKNYGAPGIRVGWMITDPTAIRHITAMFESERIAVATGAQFRAVELYEHGNAPLVDRVAEGRRIVMDWVTRHGLSAVSPGGGSQLWLDLDVGDSERFADFLMAQERLVLTTGANYYPTSARHIRIPIGIPSPSLVEALEIIADARQRILAPERRGATRRPAVNSRRAEQPPVHT